MSLPSSSSSGSTTAPAADPALAAQVSMANRILAARGVVDGFGHVTVRCQGAPGYFLIARNRAPALVQADDVLVCDLQGVVHDPQGRKSYLERFIHAAIYRARPDVQAIVHSHSPSVIPFGVTGQRLRPIFHMSGFLGSGSTLYDQGQHFGDTDMLISDDARGQALAQALGASNLVLMRGHGSTVVAANIEQVVYRAVYAEVNAGLQLQAMKMGEVRYLTEGEAQISMQSTEGQVQRAWDVWAREVAATTA
jgi:ribulose-5-phosphate 4-epimerase/fuculose-1-phosphate aldolase